jgi:hypothetical protein
VHFFMCFISVFINYQLCRIIQINEQLIFDYISIPRRYLRTGEKGNFNELWTPSNVIFFYVLIISFHIPYFVFIFNIVSCSSQLTSISHNLWHSYFLVLLLHFCQKLMFCDITYCIFSFCRWLVSHNWQMNAAYTCQHRGKYIRKIIRNVKDDE